MELKEDWRQPFSLMFSRDALSPRQQQIALGLILLTCLAVHLATMAAPALDRTIWKEIDYIEISTNYWKHGYNFFHPELSWLADPPRITSMEFPLVPYLAALLYPVFGFNVYSVRILPALGFLLLSFYVFRLVKREAGPAAGLLGALASGIMPLYHMYGPYLFSDSAMVGTSVMALYHFAEWVDDRRRRDWIVACVGFSIAIALKLFPLYLLVPMAWIVFRRHRWNLKEYLSLVKLTLLALILPALWYSYAVYLKIHYVDLFYLFDNRKFETLLMLSSPAWHHTMSQRILGMVAGKVGVLLFLVGISAAAVARRANLFFVYLLTISGYIVLTAQANQGAPYYQWPIIAPFSFFIACGAVAIMAGTVVLLRLFLQGMRKKQSTAVLCLIGGLLLVSLMAERRHADIFGKDPLKPIDDEKWKMAQIIRQNFGPDTKLLTLGEYAVYAHGRHDLSPVLYYYSEVQGWSLEDWERSLDSVESYRRKGAGVFAAEQIFQMPDSRPFLDLMKAHFRVLYETDDNLILDLRKSTSRNVSGIDFRL
jgi:4-amino-4-deoxy-L-arabinose transferase-like glycosyltransferase